jgi:hypothetical protein
MTNTVLQLLLIHAPFRRVLCQELSIQQGDIDDMKTSYDETVESKDSWISLNIACKDGRILKISARRLPQNTSWEFRPTSH